MHSHAPTYSRDLEAAPRTMALVGAIMSMTRTKANELRQRRRDAIKAAHECRVIASELPTVQQAIEQGAAAYLDSRPITDCPFGHDLPELEDAWRNGWLDAWNTWHGDTN